MNKFEVGSELLVRARVQLNIKLEGHQLMKQDRFPTAEILKLNNYTELFTQPVCEFFLDWFIVTYGFEIKVVAVV